MTVKTGQAVAIREPILTQSPLTKRIYVVTKGTMVPQADGSMNITARQKHDVTEQFKALASRMFEEQVKKMKADMEAEKATKESESGA